MTVTVMQLLTNDDSMGPLSSPVGQHNSLVGALDGTVRAVVAFLDTTALTQMSLQAHNCQIKLIYPAQPHLKDQIWPRGPADRTGCLVYSQFAQSRLKVKAAP